MLMRQVFPIALLLCLAPACLVGPPNDCQPGDPGCNPALTLLLLSEQASTSTTSCQSESDAAPFWNIFGTTGADSIQGVCALEGGDFLLFGNSTFQQTGVTILNAHANPGVDNDLFLARVNSSGTLSWMTYFGDTTSNTSVAMERTGENRYALLGYGTAMSSLHGQVPVSAGAAVNDFYVLSVDGDGNLEWFTNLGGTGSDSAGSLAYDEYDDILYLAGSVPTGIASIDSLTPLYASQGGNECALFRLDPGNGGLVWFTHLSGTANDNCRGVAAGTHGGPVVVGQTFNTSLNGVTPMATGGGSGDIFVSMLEQNGQMRWLTLFGSAMAEETPRVTRLNDGNYVVMGNAFDSVTSVNGLAPIVSYSGGAGTIDPVMLGYDPSGALLFYTYHGINADDDGTGSVISMPDGGFATTTYISQNLPSFDGKTPVLTQADGTETAIFRYDSTGNLLWYSFYGSVNSASALPLANGGFFLGMAIDGTSPTTLDGVAPINGSLVGGTDAGYVLMNSSGRMQ